MKKFVEWHQQLSKQECVGGGVGWGGEGGVYTGESRWLIELGRGGGEVL